MKLINALIITLIMYGCSYGIRTGHNFTSSYSSSTSNIAMYICSIDSISSCINKAISKCKTSGHSYKRLDSYTEKSKFYLVFKCK